MTNAERQRRRRARLPGAPLNGGRPTTRQVPDEKQMDFANAELARQKARIVADVADKLGRVIKARAKYLVEHEALVVDNVDRVALLSFVPKFVDEHPIFTRKDFLVWLEKHDASGLAALAEKLFPITHGSRTRTRDEVLIDIDEFIKRSLRPNSADIFWMLLTARNEMKLASLDKAAEVVAHRLGCEKSTVFELQKPETGGTPHRDRFDDFVAELRAGTKTAN